MDGQKGKENTSVEIVLRTPAEKELRRVMESQVCRPSLVTGFYCLSLSFVYKYPARLLNICVLGSISQGALSVCCRFVLCTTLQAKHNN